MASKTKKKIKTVQSPKWPVNTARLLLLVAMSMAGYLAWVSFSGGTVAGCGASSDCNKVLQSRWSYWLGMPVSVPALLAYGGLFAATFAVGSTRPSAQRQLGWTALIALSFMIMGAALWFVGLQVFVLQSICKFCMTAHLTGFLASAFLLSRVPLPRVDRERRKAATTGGELAPGRFAKLAAIGLAGLAVLVAGQVLVQRKTYQVQAVGETKVVEAPKKEARVVQVHEGRFHFKLDEVPVIGSLEAPHVMLSLFDYTCHYCRSMHSVLHTVLDHFTNQLAVVAVPMPLDASCNHLVTRTSSAHLNACEYAKLSLAVWKVDPKVYGHFDDWLFTGKDAPPVDQARAYAQELVGTNQLQAALADPWVNDQIKTNVSLYQTNTRKAGSGQMPQVILGAAVLTGAFRSPKELYPELERHLGLKAPVEQPGAATPP